MKFILATLLSALFFGNGQAAAPEAKIEKPSVAILGGGVGALTSALYLSRAGLEPIVIEGQTPGGALTQTHLIQNWPGELEIEGARLTEKIRDQVKANGAQFLNAEVIRVDFSKRPFAILTKSLDGENKEREIVVDACIIAMGATPNYLGIPGETGENGYWGRGVSNCAICDGALYRGQTVAIIGGGDSAVIEGQYLAKLAKKVHIFVRKETFRAKETKRLEALLNLPNVEVHYNTQIRAIEGDGEKVTGVVAQTEDKKEEKLSMDGVFLAIGSRPNSDIFKGQLEIDEKGYIALKNGQETSIHGVYAIGDVVDPVYKQAISAAGDGCKAALQLQELVSDMQNDGTLAVQRMSAYSGTVATEHRVIEVKSRKEFSKELETDLPVVVDFYATWCGPCKLLAPLFEHSAQTLDGKVKFLKVNVDECSDISREYGIRAMPTVLVFNNSGKVVDRKVGVPQISDLLKKMEAQNSN